MRLCGFEIGLDQPFFLIAGPCVIENETLAMETAAYLTALCRRLQIPFIYKSSFDKANRSSHNSFRGLGIDEGLRILHHRLMGSSHKSVYHGRLRWGRGQWFMGTHPLYIFASGIFRMRERPFVIGGLLIVAGFFEAMLRRQRRYEDLEFRKHLHSWQLKRLGLGWLAPRID